MGFQPAWIFLFVLVTMMQLPEEAQCMPRHSPDLLVSIHHSIPQDNHLITVLKHILTGASRLFHRVSKNLLLSEHITIVIPNSWNYSVSGKSNNVEDLSDIRVENYHATSEKRQGIFTMQSEGCYESGDYITVMPEFLHNNSLGETAATILLQQIIRYKYGIFENLNLTNLKSAHHGKHHSYNDKLQLMNCDGESGWHILNHIIERHQDGNELASFRMKMSNHFKAPAFKILKTMTGNTYMFLLQGSRKVWNESRILPVAFGFLEEFANTYVPAGSSVGYAMFGEKTKMVKNLTLIQEGTEVENLFEWFDVEEKHVTTNFYDGLETSLKEIKRRNLPTLGARIILLVDINQDHFHMIPNKVAHLLVINGAVLHSFIMGFANNKNHLLQYVSHHTRGQFFNIKDEAQMKKNGRQMLISLVPENIMVLSKSLTMKPKELPYKESIFIEPHLNGTHQIYIDLVESESANIQLLNPMGEPVNCSYNTTNLGKQSLMFEANQSGNWSMMISQRDDVEELNLHVDVNSRTNTKSPTLLNAWIRQTDKPFRVFKVFAKVKSANKLHHVKATAIVKHPSRKKSDLKLKDTGLGADMVPGDGIYSAYFTNYHENGTYEVAVMVSGQEHEHKTNKTLGPFQRYAYAGSFIHEAVSAHHKNHQIPPAQIRDLMITNCTHFEGKVVVSLNWTAVGENMDHGKAAAYELRITNTHKEVSLFKRWHRITQENILDGSLEPVQSGRVQKLSVTIPSPMLKVNKSRIFYIAVIALDHSHNPSAVSNIDHVEIPTESQTNQEVKGNDLELTTSELNTEKEHSTEEKQNVQETNSTTKFTTVTDNINISNITGKTLPTVGASVTSKTETTVLSVNITNLLTTEQKALPHKTSKKPPIIIVTGPETHIIEEPVKSDTQNVNITNVKSGPTYVNHEVLTTEHDLWKNTEGSDIVDSRDDKNSSASLANAKEKVRFAYINIRLSTIVASWAAGVISTFFVMAIVAAYVKNKNKKERTYNVRKSEERLIETMALKEEGV